MSERFDNFYITKGLVRLDLTRRRLGKETIFPLKYRESYTFVQVSKLAAQYISRKSAGCKIALVELNVYLL